jgi:uncharacterized protein
MSIERKPIVVDSNVLISAALDEDSISARAFRRALELFSLTRSEATFAELKDVLSRSKLDRFVSLPTRQKFLLDYSEHSRDVLIVEEMSACRDPSDDKFLSLAVASGALLLMSGDQDLRVLNPFRGIVIMSPREFLDCFPERVR